MDINNNDNRFLSNANISCVSLTSTPPNVSNSPSSSSSIILSNDSPRRSSRLSAKSPQIPSRTTTDTSIHRTVAGGVMSSHSPKLNHRKQKSFSSGRGRRSSTQSQHTLTNDTMNLNLDFDSDQSEDDHMACSNTSVEPKLKGLASRSDVLSYFELHPDGYKCKKCDNIYQASKLSDTNLRKHLASSKHNVPNVLFKSQIAGNYKRDVAPLSNERKQQLHSAAVNCVIEDGLPFNVFRRSGMASYLSLLEPGYKGPHRKTIRNRIASMYTSYTEKLRLILPQIGPLALTSDLWKSSQRISFISLTAHVFNKYYEAVPIVLGCRRFLGPHTSSNIERYIEHELNRYEIKKEQLISITTDNGSNMKKATSIKFGDRISCTNHNLNLVVHKGLYLWKEPKADDVGFQSNFEISQWEDVDDDNESDDEPCSNEDQDDAGSGLISEEESEDDSADEDNPNVDGKKDADFDSDADLDLPFSILNLNDNYSLPIDHFELLTDVYRLMKKTRLLTKFIRNHNSTNEHLNKHICAEKKKDNILGGLVLDMIVRWNSTYLMLDRLIVHKDFLNGMFHFPNNTPDLTEKQRKQLKELSLNQQEWEMLSIVKNALAPFLQSTEILSGQHYPTMAYAYYVHCQLSIFFESSVNEDPITRALKQSLRFWYNMYWKEKLPVGQMDLMLIAAFLDPFVYKLINDNDRRMAKKLIFKKLNQSTLSHSTSSPSTTPRISTTRTTANDKLNAFEKLALLCHHTLPASATTTKTTMTIDEEISWYVKSASSQTADDFQQFWMKNEKQLPRLSSLVRRINIIPATSVSPDGSPGSESLFSIASFLNRKQRSSLSSKTLRQLLVLKNRHMIEKLE